jgi:hypothetical protein
MSCVRLAASTESTAFCLYASRCRRAAPVRRKRTQRWHGRAPPFNPQLAFGNSKGFPSNTPRIPFTTAIFPIAAAAAMQIGEALHQLDAHDVFRHLVAEMP